MNRIVTPICAALFAGLLLAAAVLPGSAEKAALENLGAYFFAAQTSGQYLARDRLLGAKIHSQGGKVIGKVDDLIINEKHQIIGIVTGIGGALGFGEKEIGLRMTALLVKTVKGKIVVTLAIPDAALKDAATFKRAKLQKTLIERATDTAKKITTGTADAAKKVLKKAVKKTTETVVKAKEATKKVVEPAKKPAPDQAAPAQ